MITKRHGTTTLFAVSGRQGGVVIGDQPDEGTRECW
jgi:hypothetical protein